MDKKVLYGLLTVSLVAMTCGCKVIVPPSTIEDVRGLTPKRWSSSKYAKSGIDHQWVRSFNDSKLNSLVEKAVSSAPEIIIAQERVFQARQDISVKGSVFKPSLSLGVNAGRNKSWISFLDTSFESGSYTTDLTVNWEPDIWGAKRIAQSASVAQFQASEAELTGAKTLLAAQVCRAWFTLAEANEQLGLAREALRITKESAEAVERRFEQNLEVEGGSASQLRLAQSDTATAKATVAQRQGEKDAASRQLKVLIGSYPDASLQGRSSIPRLNKRPPVGLPSELLLRRPDIIAAERRYAAAGQLFKEAKYAIYPSFPLTASYGTSTDQLKNILDSNFGVWSLGAGLVQPILKGGRVKAEKLIRESGKKEALASLHRTVINAFGEVENAIAAELWIVKRINAFNEAHTLAAEAVQASKEDYANGTGDVLTLLNAQNRKIQIASQLASLRNLRCQTRVDLHLALGGGFKYTNNK